MKIFKIILISVSMTFLGISFLLAVASENIQLKYKNFYYIADYNTTNGITINSIQVEEHAGILILLKAENSGNVSINLPYAILQPRYECQPLGHIGPPYVLVNSVEADFTMLENPHQQKVLLSIPVSEETTELEILFSADMGSWAFPDGCPIELFENAMPYDDIIESFPQEDEISIDVIGGTLLDFELENIELMIIRTAMETDGKIILNIPKTVWHMADSDCNPASPIILVNGEETSFEETITQHKRIIQIGLSGGDNEIEIISSFTLVYAGGGAFGKFCAELENGNYLPPKKQMALGFGFHQVICKEGFILTTKSSNISPACVKPESIPKLIDRGWTKNVILQKTIKVSNSDVILRYNIENAELVEIYTDHATGSQIFNLKNSQNGQIMVEFPKLNENCLHNAQWSVLIDGEETDYVMIGRHNSIIFSIHFPENTSEIELINTSMIRDMPTGCSIIN